MEAGKNQHAGYTAAPRTSLLRAMTAEFVGTFLLVLAGTAVAVAAILNRPIAGPALNSLAVGLSFGLMLVALVAALGHISGAHFNPAVTLGLAGAGKFPWRYVFGYLVAQFLGAILAALVVWGAFGNEARAVAALGATFPTTGTSTGQAFLIEAVITFLLVFVITAVATDRRVPAPVAAPAIGFALAVAVLIGGPISGGAVNPARALGPMIVAGDFTAWWVYLLAPIIGGIVASLLYDRFISHTSAPAVEPAVEERTERRKAA